jgi:hypothetical protein
VQLLEPLQLCSQAPKHDDEGGARGGPARRGHRPQLGCARHGAYGPGAAGTTPAVQPKLCRPLGLVLRPPYLY